MGNEKIIFLNYFISAAHCIQHKGQDSKAKPQDILLSFGAHDLNNCFESETTHRTPSKIFIHPEWNPFNSNYEADIAVMLLRDEIGFTSYIKPICLFKQDTDFSEGYVTGWGRSESSFTENTPKQIKVPIVSHIDCLVNNPEMTGLVSKTSFCAGGRDGQGPCNGKNFKRKIQSDF